MAARKPPGKKTALRPARAGAKPSGDTTLRITVEGKESDVLRVVDSLRASWSLPLAIQVARDATGDGSIDVTLTLNAAGFTTSSSRDTYVDTVRQILKKQHSRTIGPDHVPHKASTKIQDVGVAVFAKSDPLGGEA